MTNTAVRVPEVLGWEDLEAMFGPGVVADLAGPDPFYSVARPELDPLDEIARGERLIAMLQGEQLTAMAAFVHGEAAGRELEEALASASAEIALVLGVAHRTADARVGDALGLAERLPATLGALRSGELTLPKARAILEETANLDVAQCVGLEPVLLAMAGGRTPGSLRRMVRARVEKVDAEAVTKRAEKARRERPAVARTRRHVHPARDPPRGAGHRRLRCCRHPRS
ncbi:MAG TPA: DUF222 domain-containing protein, partial [Sporichthyaceae bacterium]|nr:DUF222 domain-containing protein [Sporichthyaceae bacterium]